VRIEFCRIHTSSETDEVLVTPRLDVIRGSSEVEKLTRRRRTGVRLIFILEEEIFAAFFTASMYWDVPGMDFRALTSDILSLLTGHSRLVI